MAGRGPAWDKLARNDFVGTIDDQVEVLHALAQELPRRRRPDQVAIRGWSFGGYISALGVLRHPDVFGAAVAGAPCHGHAALRHLLHRALPRTPRREPGRLRGEQPDPDGARLRGR